MKRRTLISGLMSACFILGACSDSASNEYSQKFDPKVYQDFITIGQDYETLNYLISMKAVDGRVTTNFIDGLVTYDRYGQTVGSLAESWEHNEDNSVWTFHLRDGLKWTTRSGEVYGDLTADDFVYGVEYILDPSHASLNTEMVFLLDGAREYYEAKEAGEDPSMDMVGVKAIDEKTIQYTMADGGKPYFISAAMYQAFKPANRQFIESLPDSNGLDGTQTFGNSPDNILYCGMYLMGDYSKDSEKTYVKNPNYWDPENVTFDKVVVKAIRDNESALEYFERGELNWAPLSATQVMAEQEKGNAYIVQRELYKTNYVIFLNNQTSYSDDTNKAMSNQNFRKSLFHGFDQDMYNEVNIPENVESVRASTFTGVGAFITSDNQDYTTMGGLAEHQDYPYDKTLAEEYKQKAIEELTAEGVSFPIVLRYTYKSGNETVAQQAQLLKQSFETNLGTDYITIELGEYASSWYTEVRDAGTYALHTGGWTPDYADPINNLNTMMSTGQLNNVNDLKQGLSHFDMSVYDEMVNTANAEVVDVNKRYELFADAEAYLLDQAYVIPLYRSGGTYMVTSVNTYSKPYSGGDSSYLKGWEVLDHAISAEEMEGYRQEWIAERQKLGFNDQ